VSLSDEEILALAMHVGADHYEGCYELLHEELITFARLIQQKQREIDAALCTQQLIKSLDNYDRIYNSTIRLCADAIRSQKP
jgi:hypothetical protein